MWYNGIIIWLLRTPLHIFVSKNMMLLTYTGRKSGQQYTTPVNYFPARDQQGEYLATTSFAERTWWRNLRDGAPVTLHLKGRQLPAHAQVYEGQADVAQGFDEFLSQSPEMAKYFQVELDENGQPDRGDITRSVPGKVFIKTRLDLPSTD
jgi:deazaflavin-dependent oxidoreductase (nitroreductase family)